MLFYKLFQEFIIKTNKQLELKIADEKKLKETQVIIFTCKPYKKK